MDDEEDRQEGKGLKLQRHLSLRSQNPPAPAVLDPHGVPGRDLEVVGLSGLEPGDLVLGDVALDSMYNGNEIEVTFVLCR